MNDNRISLYLAIIERDYNYFMSKELRKYNLKKHDLRVLKEINDHDGINQNEICTLLKEDKITVSKSVKNLVAKGYIEKLIDLDDKRMTRLTLTEKGISDRNGILESITKMNKIIFKGFNHEDKEISIKLLKRISINMHDEVTRIKED